MRHELDARPLAESGRLLALMLEFHGCPARYAERARLTSALGIGPSDLEIVGRLTTSAAGLSAVSQRALWGCGVDPGEAVDFGTPVSRLALLDGPALRRLTDLTGIGLLHQRVSRLIARSDVQRLKDHLGHGPYRFGVERAPFLLGHRAPPETWLDASTDVLEAVRGTGARCLRAAMAGSPAALTARLALKMPGGDWIDSGSGLPDSLRARAGDVLLRVLRSEMPDWAETLQVTGTAAPRGGS
jgi:hypothetical protein